MKRRSFTREQKLAAVNKVLVQGLSYTEAARDLGIRDTLIHSWQKAFEADGIIASESEESCSVQEELKRLREENRQLKVECDILRKATEFFAKYNP